MDLNYIIVDNFLSAETALALRDKALKLNYPNHTDKQPYPGNNAEQAINLDGIEQMIAKLVGCNVTAAQGTSHAKPRLALAGEKGTGGVHIDFCHWSAILYLNLPEHCQGGTRFYHHKQTNMDHAPITEQALKQAGLDNFDQILTDIIDAQGNDPEAWQHMMTVPMKFNRLVLFRPWLYHDAGESFGNNKNNGRLIYPMFFHEVVNA